MDWTTQCLCDAGLLLVLCIARWGFKVPGLIEFVTWHDVVEWFTSDLDNGVILIGEES
jgi:hypothetical protein